MLRVIRPQLRPYAIAVLTSAIALLLTWLLLPVMTPSIFTLFYPAVMLSSLYGGLESGLLAIALAALATKYFFLEPFYSLAFTSPNTLFRFSIFVLVALMMCLLSTALRTVKRRIEASLLKLQRSEEKYRRIVETANEGIWWIDGQTRTTYVNSQMAQMLGYTPEEMLGRSSFEFIYEADWAKAEQRLEQRNPGNRETLEFCLRRKDGSPLWIQSNTSPILNDNGECLGVLAMITDISERKQAEVALRTSENLYRTLSETVPDFIWSCDHEGKVDFVNSRWLEYAGLTFEELNAGGLEEVSHPEDFPKLMQQWNLARQQEKPLEVECRYRRKDGVYRWFMVRAVPLKDAAENSIKWIGATTDIHERKQAEEALRQSEERFRVALQGSSIIVFSQDQDLRHTWIYNPHPDYPVQAVLGKTDLEVLPLKTAEQLIAVKRSAIESGKGTRCEIEMEIDGQMVTYDMRLEPLQDESGTVVGLTGAATDITEHKHFIQALRESEERFRQLAENIGAVFFMSEGFSETSPGQIIYVSPSYEKLWGRSCESLYQNTRSWLEAIHPDDRDRVISALSGMAQAQFDEKFRIVRPDGEVRWVHDRVFPVYNEHGELYRSAGIVEDITDRQRAVEALRESEERLHVALKHSPISVFNQDRELRYTWKYHPAFGHEAEDILGKGDLDILLKEDAEVLTRIKRQVLETGIGAREEVKITLQGKDCYYDLTVEPLRDANNEVIGVTCATVDITDRTQTEIALRQSETLLNALVACLPIGLAFLDHDLRYLHANEALAAINGVPLSQHIGRTLWDVLPEWAPQLAPIFEQVMQTKQPLLNQEVSGETNPPGLYRHCLVNYYPVCLPDGQVLGVGVTSMDVTELKRVEQALRESESRFRMMADGAPMFIWMSGIDGHCSYFNQLWLDFVGQTLEEALMTGWPEGIHPDDKEYCLETYMSAFNARQRFQVEYRHRRHDGEYRWVLDEGVPLFHSDGTFLGYIGSGLDISDRKRTEQAQQYLAEASRVLSSSLDYQTILTNLAHLAVPHLADWCTVHLVEDDDSVQPLATAHVNPDKIVWAKQINEKYPFDPNAPRGLANVLRTGQSEFYPNIPDHLLVEAARDVEHLHILREVGFRSAIIAPMLVRGRIVGAISFIAAESGRSYDEADLELAEELARRAALAVENARLYRQAKAAGQKAEQAADYTARLQAVTAAFSEALTPTQVAEVVVNQGIAALGVQTSCVALLADEDRFLEIVQSVGFPQTLINSWRRFSITAPVPMAQTVRTGEPIFLESVEALAQQYPVLADVPAMTRHRAFACIPITVEGRTLGGINFSFADATTFSEQDRSFMLTLGLLCGQALVRARLYETEQQARTDAEAANRIKDEFLAVLSHELRSPLNPILGWTKLLRSRKFDEKATDRALEIIERNAKLQTQLIEDLLDVSRILRGKLVLNVAPVNLVTTIEAALETVRLAAQAKDIQIHTVLESNVGQVSGDANRLQQIIWNLLSNAVKFTPQGGRVEVSLSLVNGHSSFGGSDANRTNDQGQITKYAQIQVKDTGKGISPDFLPHVFDYFRQENSTTTRQFGGLGLGLAIVRYLTELHGGTVRVESLGEGLGATFRVRLPVIVEQQEVAEERVQFERSANLTGLRILVVDDEADIRELVAFILEQSGAEVRIATSADEALVALEQFMPDLLLSDIGMPEVDGYMLMRQVRALSAEQGGQVRAIALTAYAGEYNQQQALKAGFQRHISKPVEPDELIGAIARLVGRD